MVMPKCPVEKGASSRTMIWRRKSNQSLDVWQVMPQHGHPGDQSTHAVTNKMDTAITKLLTA